MAYIVKAYIVMAYTVTAYAVIAYVVLASVVMAYAVMAVVASGRRQRYNQRACSLACARAVPAACTCVELSRVELS